MTNTGRCDRSRRQADGLVGFRVTRFKKGLRPIGSDAHTEDTDGVNPTISDGVAILAGSVADLTRTRANLRRNGLRYAMSARTPRPRACLTWDDTRPHLFSGRAWTTMNHRLSIEIFSAFDETSKQRRVTDFRNLSLFSSFMFNREESCFYCVSRISWRASNKFSVLLTS